jgi:hypothetical protein
MPVTTLLERSVTTLLERSFVRMKSRSIPQKLRPPKRPFCLGVMTDEFRGLYRTITGAYVTNRIMAFHVPEANYCAFGYEPELARN